MMKKWLFFLIIIIGFIGTMSSQTSIEDWDINPQLEDATLEGLSTDNVKKVERFLELAQKNNNLAEIGVAKVYLGHYCIEISEYEKALDLFQAVYDIGIMYQDTSFMIDACFGFGKVYDYMEIILKAKEYYEQAEHLSIASNDDGILDDVYDGIGGLYYKRDDFEKALEYMLKGKEITLSQEVFNDDIFIMNNNIADVYIKMGEVQLAIPYFEEHLTYVKDINDTLYLAYAYSNLAYAYQNIPDFEKAFMYYDTSLYYSTTFHQDETTYGTYADISEAYQAMDNYKKALEYRQKYQDLEKKVLDRLTRRQITNLEVKFNTERKEKELLLTQKKLADSKIIQQKIWLIVCVLMALLMIGFLLFFKNKEDAKKKLKLQETHEEIIQNQLKIKSLETQQLQNELENKKSDLTNLALDISRRNEFSNQLIQQLELLQKSKSDTMPTKLREIVLFAASHLRVSEDLEQFQKNIEDINQEFYQKLEARFGTLSKNEKYLCGLIRLNLSNKDVAAIRSISPSSAKVNRYRLRKKLGLDSSINIVTFLQQF